MVKIEVETMSNISSLIERQNRLGVIIKSLNNARERLSSAGRSMSTARINMASCYSVNDEIPDEGFSDRVSNDIDNNLSALTNLIGLIEARIISLGRDIENARRLEEEARKAEEEAKKAAAETKKATTSTKTTK